MNCDVIFYFAGKRPGNLTDVSLRCCLLSAGGSLGKLLDISCWVVRVVSFVQVDTRGVLLYVSLMHPVPMRIERWDTFFGMSM